jgi:hypothetical protein
MVIINPPRDLRRVAPRLVLAEHLYTPAALPLSSIIRLPDASDSAAVPGARDIQVAMCGVEQRKERAAARHRGKH